MDVVTDPVVEESQPAASNPTNPITDPQLEPPVPAPEPETKPPEPEKPTEEPVPKGVQKRIDRAVRQKYEAEARARVLQEELDRIRSAPASQSAAGQGGDKEPTIDQFDNFDSFVAAKAEWIARTQIEKTLTEREKRQQAEAATARQAEVAENWNKRLTTATVEIPDFEEVIGSSELVMTPPMQYAIMESDVGPKIAYHLALHPEEAAALARMSPEGVFRAIGRLEERIANSKPAVQVTNTPPPLKPVGGKAVVQKDPGKMSDAEYEKWRRSGRSA